VSRPAPASRRLSLWAVGDEHAASTRYRVLAHRPALEAAGWKTELHLAPGAWLPPPLRRARRAAELVGTWLAPPRADVLLVHRRTFPKPFARRLRERARWLVFDMDDAIDLPPPSRPPGERETRRYRARFEATVLDCDLVLCGNRELSGRLPHARFELLPTAVDAARFAPDRVRPGAGKTLGWVGHSDNLRYLEALEGPLRALARRHVGLRLVVAADRPPRLAGLPLEFRRWSLADEVGCFDGIDVGLMPLEDGPWARGKCAFKAIQFLALGRPVVAAPVGMAPEVVRDGETGRLARTPEEWLGALDRLLAEPAEAQALGRAGRRLVEQHYALAVVSRRLVDLLERLVDGAGTA
jgi:glycosyltransferase involved in cell wall biosynthesis